MTQQFDFLGLPLDEATTRRIDLPQPREVRKPKLRDVLAQASQLQWRPISDLTFTGSDDGIDLYAITRSPNYENYPAQGWDYSPKRIDDQARTIGAGKYTDSKLACQACQDDLQQLQRDAATTTKG